MGFQKTFNPEQPRGIPGEAFSTFPQGVTTYHLKNNSTAMPAIGLAYTKVAAEEDTAQVGGTGAFMGICVNPKEHVANNSLLPTMNLKADNTAASTYYAKGALAKMGAWFVVSTTAVTYGGSVQFNNTTGALSQPTTAGKADSDNTLILGACWMSDNSANETAIVQLGGAGTPAPAAAGA